MRLTRPIKRLFPALAILSCLALAALPACRKGSSDKKGPLAVKGLIDLRGRDFKDDGALDLSGEWEFCWDRLLNESDFTNPANRKDCGYIAVPGLWKGQSINGRRLPGKGCATYRLRILNGPDTTAKMLVVNRVYSAYRLWVNGTLAGEMGVYKAPPIAREDYVFVHNRRMYSFNPNEGTNEIVIQVFNEEYESGGIDSPVKLEDGESAVRIESSRNRIYMLIVGLLLFSALYNIMLYFFRKKDKSPLYMGLFCIVYAVNTYNIQYPILSGVLSYTGNPFLLDYASIILAMVFYIMTVEALFPDEFSKTIRRVSQLASVAAFAALPIAGFRISEKLMDAYYLLLLLLMCYITYVFVRAVLNRRDDALLFCAGFAPLVAGALNDVLYAWWIIDTGKLFPYGMVLFCITTSMVISRRFSRALVKVEELSRDLTEKNLSLERMDRLKDQFLAATSHELRTPLHGMIGLSESMIEGAAGSLPPKAIENLSLIASSGHRLSNMVNDLLDMAKIQEDGLSLNLRPVDLRSLSEMVVRLSLPLIGGKQIEIVNRIEPHIPMARADEDRIRQVLYNLVGNAIKFTNSGAIELRARVIERADSAADDDAGRVIEVRVSDTGIGVPDEFRETIFEPYRQADEGDARSYPGTGLGLAIAKRIVELHNGTIKVEPRDGGGSVFSFTLPVSREREPETAEDILIESLSEPIPADEEAARPPAATSGASFDDNPSILVVDDDPVNVRIIQNYFESRGCAVKTAADGIKALEVLENDNSIDLVLLDIMMPAMSGFEVCRRIRLKKNPEELPVIMLTAKNMMSDIDAAFGAGANDYLVKPFRISELLARTDTMLRLRSVRKSAAQGITIRDRNRTYSITFGEIVYITSHAKNIVVHTEEQDIELPVLMKEIVDRLPPDMFVRIHKSHVINIRYVRSVSHVLSGRYRVHLRDGDDTVLPVGPSFLESLRKRM